MTSLRFALLPALAVCSACAGGLEPVESPPPLPRASVTQSASAREPPIELAPAWIGAAPSRSVVVPGTGEPVWIGVWIDAPTGAPVAARPPMSLSLVVDTSGSMAGPKIENARLAATSLLEGVGTGDVVSIDAFSNDVRTLAPPTPVGPQTIGPLIEAVRGLAAMGGTNLYGGLEAGAAHAAASRAHAIRRVIVISDGQANVGPSSPEDLGQLAARGTENGVQVSAIGVGLDYDERTLGELARRSSGRLYHLEEPSQLAAILDEEVRLLGATVATGAFLEVSAGPGVTLEGAAFADARDVNGRLRIKLGALHAGQRRELLVRAKVNGSPGSEQQLATVRLVYQDRAREGRWSVQTMAVRGKLGDDARAAEASMNTQVQAIVARHEGAEAQRRAATLMNAGRGADAASELRKGEERVTAAAKRADDPAERARLTAQAARMSAFRKRFETAGPKDNRRSMALESYSYSFADDGLAAPPKEAPPRPSPRDEKPPAANARH